MMNGTIHIIILEIKPLPEPQVLWNMHRRRKTRETIFNISGCNLTNIGENTKILEYSEHIFPM